MLIDSEPGTEAERRTREVDVSLDGGHLESLQALALLCGLPLPDTRPL